MLNSSFQSSIDTRPSIFNISVQSPISLPELFVTVKVAPCAILPSEGHSLFAINLTEYSGLTGVGGSGCGFLVVVVVVICGFWVVVVVVVVVVICGFTVVVCVVVLECGVVELCEVDDCGLTVITGAVELEDIDEDGLSEETGTDEAGDEEGVLVVTEDGKVWLLCRVVCVACPD